MEIVKAFNNNQLHTEIVIKGTYKDPLFRASDIGLILEISNIHQNIQKFNKTEKDELCLTDSIGRQQNISFLTEKGLYKVLFKSRKPIAEKFQDWVCEVVKEIRLTGEYKLNKTIQDLTDELIQKDTEIIQNNIQFNINLCRNREKTLIESYKNKSVIYLAHIIGDDYKFGITTNIERRVHDHKADFGPSFILLLAFESTFYSKIENKVKTELKDKIYAKIFNEQRRVELIKINESFTQEMFYNKIQVYHKHFVDTITIETQEREIFEKDREILELKNAIIELSKTQNNNNNNNNGIITIPEIIPQELPQHEDIMDKKARQKLKKAIRDKAYREKNKEIIKIKSALHYQEKKNK